MEVVRHFITNVTSYTPITVYVVAKSFLLSWRDASRFSPPCSWIDFSFYKILPSPSLLRKKIATLLMITSSSSCLLDTAKIVLQVGRKSTRHPSRRSPVDVSFTGYNGWSHLVFLNFKRLPDLQEQGLFVHYGSSGGGGGGGGLLADYCDYARTSCCSSWKTKHLPLA